MGDLAVACFFAAEKPRAREELRDLVALSVINGRAGDERWRVDEPREAHPPLVTFHWQVEFPEVFDRDRPGFDLIVGNPPFLGGSKISAVLGDAYRDWLLALHTGSHGNADLVTHFFRCAFDLIRTHGTFGLIATNTIGQGDTRATGLGWICTHGGVIYNARKRVKWPGTSAAVVVSVVHIAKGDVPAAPLLDGRPAHRISSYLFHRGGDDAPARLIANAGKSFKGSMVYGMGFTFDDADTKGIASSLAEMRQLLSDNPLDAEVIWPYIGGEEVNNSPTQSHHRYVINFGERDERECRERWPDLMAVVEAKVKPDRLANKRDTRRRYWWRFGETTPALYRAMRDLERVLVVNCGATPHLAIAFQPAKRVFAHTLVVFPFDTYTVFCGLQARPHEVWTRFFGSSMKDDLRYTPSDCFETCTCSGGLSRDLECGGVVM